MLDIISIGDATLDTFIKIKEATVMCTLYREKCLLCLSFADKIPIVRLDQKVAGNATNNAVGSARLGLNAGLYSIIGDDEIGSRIVEQLKKEGVSLKYLEIQKKSDTNYTVVINFKGERTQLQYFYPRTYILPDIEPVRWVFYTAIGKKRAGLEHDLLSFLRRVKSKLGFNPGASHLKEGIKKMQPILKACEVFFVNKEEAIKLVGNTKTVTELLYRLHRYGPDIVVITDGANGAYAYDGINIYHQNVFPAKLVERTGAGDAFATGFLAALFHGEEVKEALRWGSANSASVISKIGPQDGLLTLAQIKRELKKHYRITPKLIRRRTK